MRKVLGEPLSMGTNIIPALWLRSRGRVIRPASIAHEFAHRIIAEELSTSGRAFEWASCPRWFESVSRGCSRNSRRTREA